MIFREFPGDGACGVVQIPEGPPPVVYLHAERDEFSVVGFLSAQCGFGKFGYCMAFWLNTEGFCYLHARVHCYLGFTLFTAFGLLWLLGCLALRSVRFFLSICCIVCGENTMRFLPALRVAVTCMQESMVI